MKTILALVLKDLRRDLRHPWGTLILMSIPVLMIWLMSAVFGGGDQEAPEIVLHVAVIDHDDDFFSRMLRSMGSQGDAGQNLELHFVDTLDEGIGLLEDRTASALMVLPEHMTSDLLDGATATIQIYKNPAQGFLPKVVEQGADILAVGISEILTFLGPEIRQSIQLFDRNSLPPSWTTAMLVYQGMQKVETVQTYFFPPIIQFDTVAADEYVPQATAEIAVQENPTLN